MDNSSVFVKSDVYPIAQIQKGILDNEHGRLD